MNYHIEKHHMNIYLEQLKNLIMKYDHDYGKYPENEYEGLSVYEFICQELNIESGFDLPYREDYTNLLRKNFKENN